jgi:hypothetical protein
MMQPWGITGLMGAEGKQGHYWRDVFKGAWASTLDLVGWDKKKALSAAFVPIGTLVITGIANGFSSFSTIISLLVGVALLVPLLFLWGIIQTQADMYRDLAKQQTAPAPPVTAPETNHLATPKPDFEMWRHRENLTLLEAAQLWAGVRPSVAWGTRGAVNDTYAMLSGAIQKGELSFLPEGSTHPPAWNTAVQMEKKNPNPSTKLTRTGLKTFAAKYSYDPEFLRGPAGVET